MIQPVNFGFNAETAVNNAFQMQGHNNQAQEKALIEFNNFVKKLELYGINVTVIKDTPIPHTPDSIFPNNWISFHNGNKICLYPMFAKNRRLERDANTIKSLKTKFSITETIDFTHYENQEIYLEGTGSMVLDRENKIAYACLSPRTDKNVFTEFCEKLDFVPVSFDAVDTNGDLIYHTNVMMCVGKQYVIICLDSIKNPTEKEYLISNFKKTNKKIIEISYEQMNNFAGNMLQVISKSGELFLVMSSTAFRSLTTEQVSIIRKYNQIIDAELDTIEKNGGGSARCMLAEIFLDSNGI